MLSLRTDRILEFADALERHSTPVPGFDMRHFYTSEHATARNVNRIREDRGGLTAGLAAHVVIFFADVPVSTAAVQDAAMQILGLSGAQAETLFAPRGIRPRDATRAIAVATLRRLVTTGDVTWRIPTS